LFIVLLNIITMMGVSIVYCLQLICVDLSSEYIVVRRGMEKEWDFSRLFCG